MSCCITVSFINAVGVTVAFAIADEGIWNTRLQFSTDRASEFFSWAASDVAERWLVCDARFRKTNVIDSNNRKWIVVYDGCDNNLEGFGAGNWNADVLPSAY